MITLMRYGATERRQRAFSAAVLALFFALLTAIGTVPVGAASPSGTAIAAAPPYIAEGTSYKDPHGRYSLRIAAFWVQAPSGSPDSFLSHSPDYTRDPNYADFQVNRRDAAVGMSTDDFAQYVREWKARNVADYRETDRAYITLAGRRAVAVDTTYTFTDANGSIAMREFAVYLVNGSDGWILHYAAPVSAFEIHGDDGVMMLKSFIPR